MSYSYRSERPTIFTEDGQVMFLKIRDKARELIGFSGAARMQEIIEGISGSTWQMLACVDRLVELDELFEITQPRVIEQHRVFVGRER